jgi:hypothetical protein
MESITKSGALKVVRTMWMWAVVMATVFGLGQKAEASGGGRKGVFLSAGFGSGLVQEKADLYYKGAYGYYGFMSTKKEKSAMLSGDYKLGFGIDERFLVYLSAKGNGTVSDVINKILDSYGFALRYYVLDSQIFISTGLGVYRRHSSDYPEDYLADRSKSTDTKVGFSISAGYEITEKFEIELTVAQIKNYELEWEFSDIFVDSRFLTLTINRIFYF